MPLLVLRRGGTVNVLSDRCSHLSGPLHEGELEDGCVVCPWHGSTFRLADGSVRRGPATAPVPAFDTRVSSGRVAGPAPRRRLTVERVGRSDPLDDVPAGRQLVVVRDPLLLEPGRGLVELGQHRRSSSRAASPSASSPSRSKTPQARSTGWSTSSRWMRRS